jgi:anti-anti-sigma factor
MRRTTQGATMRTTDDPGLGVDLSRRTSVELAGDLDLASVQPARDRLAGLDLRRRQIIELDLTAVAHCDSSGLSLLVEVREALGASGGQLVLRGVSDHLRRVLEITGLDATFTIVP